ncbi:MAG: FAD-dependent oxidoreductase [Opitutaceae bacterium]
MSTRADILIVGQGLAGTLLAWELERAGISFEVIDAGHEHAASGVAAGIINPITGRRLVKSWRVDQWLPTARIAYREIEQALGLPLWRDVRVRRFFADDRERRVANEKYGRGELAPYVEAAPDETGLWIGGAGQVDVPSLLARARAHWQMMGRLREETLGDLADQANAYHLVVDCRGVAGARGKDFAFVPWEFSKGEIIAVQVAGLPHDVVLNRGHWALPVTDGSAWVGATHQPSFENLAPTAAARKELEASAAALLSRPFSVTGHFAGVRVNLPDKRPVAGRHPASERLGIMNGLGAKGALWAPMLARQWVNHLTKGVPFDPEITGERFWQTG